MTKALLEPTERPTSTDRVCNICKATVAAWPNVMVCHCYEMPWEQVSAPQEPDELILGVGDGSGKLFVRGSYEAIKSVQQMIFDLERLTAKAQEPDDALIERLTKPIIGIENRTALEAFDIMADRIRRGLQAKAPSIGRALDLDYNRPSPNSDRRDGAKPMKKHRVTLASLERILIHMSDQLDRLTASVASLKTVDESAAALLSNIAQQLRDSATDPAAINKLADDIDADNAALAAAITANTPAAAATSGAGSTAAAGADTGTTAPPADTGSPA